MKNLVIGLILLILSFSTKWFFWDLNISSGKIIGTIQQISQKGNLIFFKHWEGSLLTNGKIVPFSIKENRIGLELLKNEGKEIVLYFNQNLVSWPRNSDISITEWKFPKEGPDKTEIISIFEKSLFCSFLGSLLKNKELYQQVKEYIRVENIYLYHQYQKCNN